MPEVELVPDGAEAAFGFLSSRGFVLTERWVTGGNSLHDGWRLTYERPDLCVTVQFFDAQFDVRFRRAGVEAEYLFLDREFFQRHSGLGGNKFWPPKLDEIVDRVAADIRDNYGLVLDGEADMWTRIERQLAAPEQRRLP